MSDPRNPNTRLLTTFRLRGDSSLPGLQKIVGTIVTNASESLRTLIDLMFANVDDFFFDMADKSSVSENRSKYLDAMRLIRIHRKSISDNFFAALQNSVLAAWGQPTTAEKSVSDALRVRFGRDDMAVLNDEEMELAVTESGIVSTGNVRYGYELGCLTKTLNSISKRAAVDAITNPLGVRTITRSFIASIDRGALEVEVLVCFLKLFQRDVADQLGGIYLAALDRLEKSGVTLVGHKVDERPAAVNRKRDDSRVGHRGTADFVDLREYLSASSHNESRISSSSSSTMPVQVGQLLETVAAVQNKYLEQVSGNPIGGSFPNLRTFLLSLPSEQGGFQNAGEAEQDALRLISDLFEHMFRNENLSLASKALIARLQLPVLKVALLDKSIFSNTDHSTRQLLNRMAIDGIGWSTSVGILERHPLYRAAEDLVRRINDEFTDDVSMFDLFLDEWNTVVASKLVRVEKAEKRINESALGKAKLDAAKGIVRKVVNKRATGLRLPPGVASFIAGDWTDALVMTCIKFGTSSDQWNMAVETLDELLTASQPAAHKDESEVRGRNLTNLASRLSEGLNAAGSTRLQVGNVLETAVAALERLASEDEDWFSGTAECNVESMEIVDEIAITGIDDFGDSNGSVEPSLRTLRPGDWIEIDDPGGDGALRCKLIVVVDASNTYVFGNDVGLKVCEKSANEIARGMAAGDIRVIHEELLVDRAIDDLLAELRASMRR